MLLCKVVCTLYMSYPRKQGIFNTDRHQDQVVPREDEEARLHELDSDPSLEV